MQLRKPRTFWPLLFLKNVVCHMHQIRSSLFWRSEIRFPRACMAVFIHQGEGSPQLYKVFLAKTIRDMDSLLGVCD